MRQGICINRNNKQSAGEESWRENKVESGREEKGRKLEKVFNTKGKVKEIYFELERKKKGKWTGKKNIRKESEIRQRKGAIKKIIKRRQKQAQREP